MPHFAFTKPDLLTISDAQQFKSSYINQGIEGGKKAAYALRSAIARECGEHADEIEVVCNVYANLAGLSKAMKRDGSLELESDMKDFTLGFTQAKASFDFVDVGHGKERADSKIKGKLLDTKRLTEEKADQNTRGGPVAPEKC